jgi:lysophospholipase L1-like esterase
MFKTIQALLVSILLVSTFCTYASEPNVNGAQRLNGPEMMGVMGDSISAGTLADFPIPNANDENGSVTEKELQEQVLLENKLTLSWASGIEIRSHYIRLLDYMRRNGEHETLYVDNVSYPGKTSSAMEGQALQLLTDFITGGYSKVKYITLLIGSNDACSPDSLWGVPPENIRSNLMKAFRVLSRFPQSDPIRILVVGIPRIPELAEPDIRYTKTVLGLSCEKVRNKILRECNSLLTWNTETEYDQKMMIIENDNRTLREVVQEANQTFPNIQAVYSDRLYNLKLPRSILAADCFHPNANGQEQLADQVWLDQPWFD